MHPEKLAIDGGKPTRRDPMPPRRLIGEAERAAAMRVFDDAVASGNAFGYNGVHEQQYEKDFADFMGGGFADAVNSGTNALYCALGGLEIEPFSEVIVPPITDPGGCMPVALLGLIPVVADSDPRTFNTSAEQIEPMITDRTRAVIIAHIAGDPVQMPPVVELCRRRNLHLIEDCAQSHGARCNGRLVGTFGDVAAFSTMSGKHHCTAAQGGVVYTQNQELHFRCRRFADRGKPFGLEPAAGNTIAGLNCNSNDLSAAVGSAQLRRLPDIIQLRRRIGEGLRHALAERQALSVGWQAPDTESVYWFIKIRVEVEKLRVDKAAFAAALAAEGIPSMADYRHIPAEAPWFRQRRVLGTTGFPWTNPAYQGPREPVFRIHNAIAAVERHMYLAVHEGYGPRELSDILAALEKLERNYMK